MIIFTEHMKSDAMKQKEEELIMKKIALVNEKNEIIHRIDEKEEESVLFNKYFELRHDFFLL